MATRGYRNNNPGNLKISSINWQGKVPVSQNTDGTFEQFISMPYGIRAMYMDLINDTIKKGKTITEMLYEYAPPSENDTLKYISDVDEWTGTLDMNTVYNQFTFNELIDLTKAMIKKEIAPDHVNIKEADYFEAFELLPQDYADRYVPTFTLEEKKNFVPNYWTIGGIALLLVGAGVYFYNKKK